MKQPFELRSKLVDGLLTGGVLVLMELVLILMFKPVLTTFGRPGLLIYTVSLIALAALCLEQSLAPQQDALIQPGWGTLGGLVGWVVIELSTWLGGQSLLGEAAILSLMFLMLIVSTLWRHTDLPGLRYFVTLLLLGWVGHVAVQGLSLLDDLVPEMTSALIVLGWLGAAGLGAVLLYNFFFTHSRQERLNAAILVRFAVMVMIYAFRGGFI